MVIKIKLSREKHLKQMKSLIHISKGNPFQTNKWLAKKMQFQQPDIREETDRHRTIIRD
jgi:hypothetical protein